MAWPIEIPPGVVTLEDYEPLAEARLEPSVWGFLAGGAADELTLRWNREAFARLRLQGRVLRDMTQAHTRVTLLGTTLDYPILLAPVAYQNLIHPDGERATVEGAAAMRAGMVVSTNATVSMEDIAAASQGTPLWFQLYMLEERASTQTLIARAEAAGYQALVVTVDAPINGVRNREQRSGFRLTVAEPVNLRGLRRPYPAATPSFVESPLFNGFLKTAPTWQDVEWLQSVTRLPILLKGVMSPDDAARAAAMGVAGLVVSNHGGRTLDTLPATIEVLPRIVEAVNGRVPILMDGGIRRGTDVLKALALGASAVLVGRPYAFGLAVSGAVGVAHVLSILRAELEAAMVLTGCPTVADVDRSVLWV
jgi:4-hydroxymandelate oxidase